MRLRMQRLKLWTTWATELAIREKSTYRSATPQVQAVLGAKRLLLVERVAESINWPDTTLFQEMSQGFQLVGTGDEIICFSIWYQSGFNERRTTDEGCQVLKPALLGRYGRALEMPTARNFTSSVKVKLLIKGGCLALYTALEMDECFFWVMVSLSGVLQSS